MSRYEIIKDKEQSQTYIDQQDRNENAQIERKGNKMKFEEYVSNDIDNLLKEFGRLNDTSFQQFKQIWKKLNFSRIHYVSVKSSKTIQIIYAVILLKLNSYMKDAAVDKDIIIGLVYTLITIYYTQVSSTKEHIRIRMSDYRMLKNIQEIYLSVDKNQTTDVVQLLLDNNCLTIAAYIGPSGFAQSMKTLTNDWESLLDDYNNSNTTTGDGEITTYTETNKNIQNRLKEIINLDEMDSVHSSYTESIQKLLRNLKDKQQNGNGRNSNSNASRRNASFLKPFRSVHGKAAGHVSSRNISSTRLKRDLRYIAVFNPNNKRFKQTLDNYKIHSQNEKIKFDMKHRDT